MNLMKKSSLFHKKMYQVILALLLLITTTFINIQTQPTYAKGVFDSTYPFVIISSYNETLAIGDSIYLIAFTSTGNLPTWKSSDSKIASVNTYGNVIAKKSGVVTITAKIKGAESSCKITVKKTTISVNQTSIYLEHGETFLLESNTSTGSEVTYKTNRKSIATVNENGLVTGMKPGEAIITISADGSSETCKVKVKSPQVSLSKSTLSLFRGQTHKLSAKVSSNLTPKWKSNKKSVAIVDETGNVKAVKHGTAIISATIDGVTRTCTVIVNSPTIELSTTNLSLLVDQTTTLYATVSSGNTPAWSCSNSNILEVKSDGSITALKKGTAYVYATEDGTKVKCKVIVTEPKK